MTDEQRLSMADTFRRLTAGDEEGSYWAGYLRGTRRKIHGKNFGTEDDHQRYVALVGDGDPDRDAIGRGYADGLAGVVPEKMKKGEG